MDKKLQALSKDRVSGQCGVTGRARKRNADPRAVRRAVMGPSEEGWRRG